MRLVKKVLRLREMLEKKAIHDLWYHCDLEWSTSLSLDFCENFTPKRKLDPVFFYATICLLVAFKSVIRLKFLT